MAKRVPATIVACAGHEGLKKVLSTNSPIATGEFCGLSPPKQNSFPPVVICTERIIGLMCKFTNAGTFCFLLKCIILVFVGDLTIRIQNSYIRQVRYETQLFNKARCSEASWFSVTKICYAQGCQIYFLPRGQI